MKTRISSKLELPAEIIRNLEILYSTAEGTVVGDREFGINFSLLDLPIPLAQVKLIAEYTMKTKKHEPRVKVVEVTFVTSDYGITEAKVVIDWM